MTTLCFLRSNMPSPKVLLINFLCPATGTFIVGIIAYLSDLPFLFPSLGPTTFLHFAIFAKAPASPRNTIIGHFIGIVFGMLGLAIFGLVDKPSAAVEVMSMNRVGCATFAIGFTCIVMIVCKVEHPPAAATTLLVAMGVLKQFTHLVVLMSAVGVLTIYAFIMNRMLRNDGIYPIWRSVDPEQETIATLTRENFGALMGFLEPLSPLSRQGTEKSMHRLVEKQDTARNLLQQLERTDTVSSIAYQHFP
eukprot:UN02376